MRKSLKDQAVRLLQAGVAMIPWILAMYALYWLDASGRWTAETPHRGKIAVGLLATGMALSFLIYSRFTASKQ